MKRHINTIFSCVLAFLLLFDFLPLTSFAKDFSTALDALSGPHKGYTSISDLDGKYHGGVRLTSIDLSGEECVSYALNRSKEKLFGRNVSYSVGNTPLWSGNGKEVAKKFYDYGYRENGPYENHIITSKDGTDYNIKAYINDNGSHITSNSLVCFNSDSNMTDNSTYGHIVYVEEVAVLDGIQYVYYTEGGSSMSSWGVVKRKTFDEFYNNENNRKGYTGTIVFAPACNHSYGSDGLCTICHKAWMPNNNNSVSVSLGTYKVKSGVTAYLRLHPYAASNTANGEPATASAAGTQVQVTSAVENGLGHIWYYASYNGKSGYVFSENMEYIGSHTHDKSAWVFYEAAHPHYDCYRCSVCGEVWRDTSSSNYVNSCTECNPPANPGLSINPTTVPSGTLTEGNSFSLQGTVTSNYPVTYFEGVVYDSARQIFISAGCYPNSYSVDIRSSNVNQNLPFGSLTTGSYYLVYNAVDSSGKEVSWCSDWFTIAGGSTLPAMPTVTVPQSTFQAGQTVTIDWTAAAGNDSYWINVLRDGALIVDQAMGQTRTYYLQNAEIGSYTVYVSANNSAGTSGSSVCYFQVVEPNRILDINGVLNGQESGDINSFGTFDLYVNGSAYRTNCSDFCDYLPVGSTYEIKNITPYYGCSYDGIYSGNRAGTIGSENASVWLSFSTNDYSKITEMPSASYNSSNGHTYFYYATPVTWYFAEGFCASVGGHLVTLSDATENQFVKELVGGNFAWIGLSDAGSENAWHWITGESYAFSDWYPGQPDNYSVNSQGSEDYVQYNNIAWNDNDGAALMGFVCEIEDPSLILNINGVIDGVMQEGLNGCGTADIYINGICVAEGCSDYYMAWPKGTTYEIKNIHPTAGYSYDGIYSGSRTGMTGAHDPLVCLSFSENDCSRITETPTQSHFNGHTYLYYSSPVTWYFAKEYCESLRGHLITITSEQENQLAKQITDNNNVWLGASDAGSEGTWYWVTGEPFEYTNWLELQPDNTPNDSTGEENYAELNPTWTTQQGWNDVRGCVTHGFICEFDYISCINGHSYVNTVTEPTCTEQGYTTHTCSVCGDTYVDSYVGALGHSFGAWTQSKAPSCTEKGTEKRSCSRCGKTETREIAALGHDYHAVVTAPTCTEKGYTTYTCSRCGDSYVADEVAALGHTPGAAVEENRINPTCTVNGGFDTVTYCSVCGVELTRVHTDLAALGHVWDNGVVNPAATCTTDGVKTYTCQRCGETKTEAIAASGHTPSESVKENEVAATCTTAGGYDMVVRCKVCNAILYAEHFEIAALGHDYQAVVTEPTCTEKGYTTYTCSRCGDSYVADETAALGHDWSEWRPVPMNFCTDPRVEDRTCNRCGATESRTLPPDGHVPGEPVKENEVAPTCKTTGGYDMAVYCTVCGAEISREHTDIPALGHDWNAPEYVWADDYSTVTATRTCKNDASHVETETVDSTAEVTKEATVDEEGEITYTAVFENPAFETQTKAVATPKLEKPDDPKPTNPFVDVQDGAYYYDAVLWAVNHDPQITNGTSATTFSPTNTCTRAQVVTFLWRAKGSPEPTKMDNPFTDVQAGTYYYKAVLWAVENGITNGTSATTFGPTNGCTRAQVVTFLWRTEGQPEPKTTDNPFTDVTGGYYYKAVLWAVENKITNGTSATTFGPDATCTRGQIVTFLYRDLRD